MTNTSKSYLTEEASRQMKAIKLISRWRTLALVLSMVGAALTYVGFFGSHVSLFPGILGIFLILTGFLGAAVFSLGIKNGRHNVHKILKAAEGE